MTDPRLKSHEELKAAREMRRAVKLRTPMKSVNKERVAKKETTEGFDPDYLAWIRLQPCIITGLRTGEILHAPGTASRPIRVEAAHMLAGRTKGTDMTALPVDRLYHRHGAGSQHVMGIKSWAHHYRLDLPALIAAHRKRYSLEMAAKVAAKHG